MLKLYKLPLEISVYFILWIYGVTFVSIKFLIECQVFSKIPDKYGDFKSSHFFKFKKRDSSDLEWEGMTRGLILALPWVIIQIIVAEVLRENHSKIVPYWQALVGIFFLALTTNIKGLCLVSSQLILFDLISKFNSVALIWMISFLYLLAINFFKSFDQSFGYNYLEINEFEHYLLILCFCWMNLRCLSFYIDVIKSGLNHKNNIFKIFCYCFYLPSMFCGPFMYQTDIKKSYSKSKICLRSRIFILLKDILKVVWWYFLLEVLLHFFYANAFSLNPYLVKKFNSWALYGYGYWMGQLFHIKYLVFYGFSTSIAKFENIPVPALPKCIGRIHLYSDMWKYFDRGLYSFLLKYIYLPNLTNKSIFRKISSSFLCFAFVYIWHGTQYFILVWASLNLIGVTLETLCKYFSERYLKLGNFSNQQWERRLACLLASPLLAVSCVSNFYFFGGAEIGAIFADRLINDKVQNTSVLLFILYCCGQVSSEIKIWEKSKTTK